MFFVSKGVVLLVHCFVFCFHPSRGYPDRDLVKENPRDIVSGDSSGRFRGWPIPRVDGAPGPVGIPRAVTPWSYHGGAMLLADVPKIGWFFGGRLCQFGVISEFQVSSRSRAHLRFPTGADANRDFADVVFLVVVCPPALTTARWQ